MSIRVPDPIVVAAIFAGLVSMFEFSRRVLWPVAKALVDLSNAWPVLLDISNEFKPNGGASLHDVVARIEATVDSTNAVVTENVGRISTIELKLDDILKQGERLIIDIEDGESH